MRRGLRDAAARRIAAICRCAESTSPAGKVAPLRKMRVYGHVSTVQAAGSGVAFSAPTVGETEDEQSEWRDAHRIAVATALKRMPRSKLARQLVKWLDEMQAKFEL